MPSASLILCYKLALVHFNPRLSKEFCRHASRMSRSFSWATCSMFVFQSYPSDSTLMPTLSTSVSQSYPSVLPNFNLDLIPCRKQPKNTLQSYTSDSTSTATFSTFVLQSYLSIPDLIPRRKWPKDTFSTFVSLNFDPDLIPCRKQPKDALSTFVLQSYFHPLISYWRHVTLGLGAPPAVNIFLMEC